MPSLSERLLAEAEEESMSRNLYNRGVAVDHDEWLGPDDDFDPYQIIDDEDDDLEDLEDMKVIFSQMKQERKIKWEHKRVDWNYHRQMLVHTEEFENRFRMKEAHFDALLDILRDSLTVSVKHSMSSTGGNEPICPEVILACGLRFLGLGENPPALADMYGMSVPSAKRVVRMFLNAIDFNDTCPELRLVLPDPTDRRELEALADEWRNVSTAFGLLNGHLGALDGWLPRTEAPRDVKNQAAYFSGHYQCYGLNCQALCDPDLLFMYFCVAAPGKTNDVRAFGRCRALKEWLAKLPDEYFIGGDNAYTLTDKLVTPYTKAEIDGDEHKRTYNYYLSQLRIRIEMAFGRLTTKWRRLRSTLNFSNKTNSQIIRVCTKLHNYCIRMSLKDGTYVRPVVSGNVDELNPSAFGVDPFDGGGNRRSKWGYLESDPEAVAAPVRYSVLVTPDSSRRE
eukprot:scaffold2915_cov88-Skeletonema_marinoi.AAC.1